MKEDQEKRIKLLEQDVNDKGVEAKLLEEHSN